jgi:hypothetical protein
MRLPKTKKAIKSVESSVLETKGVRKQLSSMAPQTPEKSKEQKTVPPSQRQMGFSSLPGRLGGARDPPSGTSGVSDNISVEEMKAATTAEIILLRALVANQVSGIRVSEPVNPSEVIEEPSSSSSPAPPSRL